MRKLILSFFMISCLATFAADRALVLSGGSGTEADPWLLSSKSDFIELANACNTPEGTATNGTTASHYSGKYFLLTADVDFGGDDSFTGIAVAPAKFAPGTTWKFQGHFDGGNHTVSGLNIKGVTFDSTGKAETSGANRSRNYVGLFGYVEGGSVKNIKIAADCIIEGYAHVGSIAGSVDKGASIDNCRSLATVKGYDSRVGGIVGNASAAKATPGTITNCCFGGDVRSCNAYVGGIVGYQGNAYMSISRCANFGSVTAQSFNAIKAENLQTTAGGIVGSLSGPVSDCFNCGCVMASKEKAGGIAGAFSGSSNKAERLFNIGTVFSPSDITTGVLFGTASGKLDNCVYDIQMCGDGAAAGAPMDGASGMATAQLTAGTLPEGFSSEIWMAQAGFYPVMKAFNTEEVHRAAATYLIFPEAEGVSDFRSNASVSTAMAGITVSSPSEYLTVENGSALRVNKIDHIVQAKATLTNGNYKKEFTVTLSPTFFTGAGSQDDPYIIDSPRALAGLAEMCNGVMRRHFEGKYFKQTADIDLSAFPDFIGIGTTPSYVTITKAQYYFSGNYDGGGHKISGINVNGVVFDEENKLVGMQSYASVGLFGVLRSGAGISNINIDKSCKFTGYNNVGSLVGEISENVKISNCSSAATVTAYGTYSGGLAGHCTASKTDPETIAVENSVFMGCLKSNASHAGGILGWGDAVVTDCVNGGSISVEQINPNISLSSTVNAGGIVGRSEGTISHCLNLGTVKSQKDNVGGIAGQTYGKRGHIISCVNAGQIISDGVAGAIVGNEGQATSNNPIFTGNIYDTQYSGRVASGSAPSRLEATGMTTAELTSENLPDNLEGWTAVRNFYILPSPLAENQKAKEAAATYMLMDSHQKLSNFTDGILADAMPLTASVVEGGDIFHVSGGKVLSHAVADNTSGVVRIENGDYSRDLVITKIPDILPGNGTADDPFIIATPQDFLKLASTVASGSYGYDGRYFSMTANLDFTGLEFTPVGTLSVPFGGIFDGNGNTVSNVVCTANENTAIRDIALFAYVGETGCIKNLKLKSSDLRCNLNAGGITSILDGKVDNCSVDNDVIVYSILSTLDSSASNPYRGVNAGGIAAQMSEKAVIANCTNGAKVVADQYVGGIVGTALSKGSLITNCTNKGEIGGILTPVELFGGNAMTGGIAGRFRGSVQQCDNEGRVVTTQANTAGGIVGGALAGALIENCTNSGLVEVNWLGGGGIVGLTASDAVNKEPVVITDCSNSGVINASAFSGGIIGNAENPAEVARCFNTASFSTREGASCGGIIGFADANVNVEDCYNTGTMKSTRSSAGIVGEMSTKENRITRCFNAGNILSVSDNEAVKAVNAGGIANIYFEGSVVIESCYNVGDISGASEVGGIMGNALNSSISNCYNIGSISSDGAAGNIAATATKTEPTNCFFPETLPKFATDKSAVQVSMQDLMTAGLGENFIFADAFLPRIKGLELVPEAVINAALFLTSGDETWHNVSEPLTLSQLDGLSWSCSGPAEIIDNQVKPNDKGEFTLTSNYEGLTKRYQLTSVYDSKPVGIDTVSDIENMEIIGWCDLSGKQLSHKPTEKGIYVTLLKTADGAIKAVKVQVSK